MRDSVYKTLGTIIIYISMTHPPSRCYFHAYIRLGIIRFKSAIAWLDTMWLNQQGLILAS